MKYENYLRKRINENKELNKFCNKIYYEYYIKDEELCNVMQIPSSDFKSYFFLNQKRLKNSDIITFKDCTYIYIHEFDFILILYDFIDILNITDKNHYLYQFLIYLLNNNIHHYFIKQYNKERGV